MGRREASPVQGQVSSRAQTTRIAHPDVSVTESKEAESAGEYCGGRWNGTGVTRGHEAKS